LSRLLRTPAAAGNGTSSQEQNRSGGVCSEDAHIQERDMNKLIASAAFAAIALTAAPPVIMAQGTTQTITAVDVRVVATGLRSSKIVGSDVVNANKEQIGKVDDLIITPNHDVIAVLSVGGFLGIGSKLVAVQFDQLRPTSDNQGFVLAGATKDDLMALPDFKYQD
jgi:hypothetical protein